MIVAVACLLLIVSAIAFVGATLRGIEADGRLYQLEHRRSEDEHHRGSVACSTLDSMVAAADRDMLRIRTEMRRTIEERQTAEAELAVIQATPKQRLHLFDKPTLAHAKLWEVTVINTRIESSWNAEALADWAAGRIYLLGAALDRDARHRVESRFPVSQGYRILKIGRFRGG
ncbi:hypothetical protein [Oleisolibacter albus]|uniref:hypothetical protein n=1 Tax=Oleisolibacter albus TaxID=2171757 RepID=UPI000DF335CD|nr:hypothetical protein [Oleisolibacter albus]